MDVDVDGLNDIVGVLEEADVKSLLMVLVHFTKDKGLLAEAAPYITGAWDYMHKVPADLQKRIRDGVARIVVEGRKDTDPPDHELLHLMMDTFVRQGVPEEYDPLLRERFAFTGSQIGLRDVDSGTRARNGASGFKVIVIGAGMSGICTSIRLANAGIDHVIFEKNDEVGGTWYENSYPGAGVDTPNHVYSYSFEPNHNWPEYFSRRDQLFDYFRNVARKYGVKDRTQFGTAVLSASYDEKNRLWSVRTSRDGKETVHSANIVIFAVGLLNRPSVPSIPGLGSFKGPVVHTGKWDHSVQLAGKTVGLIGTGASGMQVGPTIAPEVKQLKVFQRSPHWLNMNPNYHRRVTSGKQWALKNVPYYAEWYRFQLFWASSDAVHSSLFIDRDWPTPAISLNAVNDGFRNAMTDAIHAKLGGRPDLISKVVPRYPPYGKRMLRDNNWCEMLLRDNVDLITDKIVKITETAVVTTEKEHAVDVIVLATGFKVGKPLGPIRVTGRKGVEISEIWGEDNPRAYLGITVPAFPNMFIIYGPNTNLAHGGTAVFHTECQVEYAMQAIQSLIDARRTEMECRQSVHDEYNERVDAALGKMVWSHPDVTSWYKNKAGRVFATTPWRLVDYWHLTRKLDPSDYVYQ